VMSDRTVNSHANTK